MQNARSKLLYAALVAIAALATVVAIFSDVIGGKEVAGTLLALFGTFLGALFAFRLNQEKDRQQLLKDQKVALNRAMFVLLRQYNAICTYQKYLAAYTSPIEQAFMLPAQKPPAYSDLVHDFGKLEFLLETEFPNVLMRLTIEQERFHQVFESIRLRNEFYVYEVLPALARMNIKGKPVTMEQLHAGLGERIFGTALTGVNEVYYHVPACEVSLKAMHQEVFVAAKALFPDEKFIKAQDA